CGSLPVVQSVFSCSLLIEYAIAGNRVINRILSTSHARRVAPSRFGLEHPRPHAFWCHRLRSPSAREPADHRESKGSAGETSVVRKPVAGEGARCFRCRSWTCIVYASGKVG